jgi:hypothetical protein
MMVGLRCRAASIGGAAAPPYQLQFVSKSLFLSGFRPPASVCSAIMFETVKSEITTAAGKLTHLRRFL